MYYYIDGKAHKLGTKSQQELFNQSCNVQIMHLLIYSLGGGHTRAQLYAYTYPLKVILTMQACAGLYKASTEFKYPLKRSALLIMRGG